MKASTPCYSTNTSKLVFHGAGGLYGSAGGPPPAAFGPKDLIECWIIAFDWLEKSFDNI